MRIRIGRWLFVLVLRREDPNRRRACPVCQVDLATGAAPTHLASASPRGPTAHPALREPKTCPDFGTAPPCGSGAPAPA